MGSIMKRTEATELERAIDEAIWFLGASQRSTLSGRDNEQWPFALDGSPRKLCAENVDYVETMLVCIGWDYACIDENKIHLI